MLQCVAIKNYKIFNNEQILDFRREKACPNFTGSLFTLVGENGCGKSTLLNLIGLASNFGCEQRIQDVRVCDTSKESFVKCEYSIDNWSQLPDLSDSPLASNYPEFKLWFLDGLLKIPTELVEYLQLKLGSTASLNLIVVIGFKRVLEANSNETISKFLHVKCNDKIIAINQPINGTAEVGVFPCSATEDLLNWRNPETLQATELNFLVNRDADHNSGTDTDYSHPPQVAKTVNPQSTMVLDLIRTVDPIKRGTIWNEVIKMFHELTGDQKITIKYEPLDDSITIIEKLDGVEYEKYDLPEGFFYAFILAFLLVNPSTNTLLLDEPTRGMHPLQIRRLRRILSNESRQSHKVIIVSAHAPDMLHGSPIDQIFRFRRLTSGFSEIGRVSCAPSERDARFVCTGETRELFFTRRIIWVEGDTDRQFFEAMLKLIDEGSNLLWNALLKSVPQRVAQTAAGGDSLQNLFASPAYQKKTFTKDVFEKCRERTRSCSVLQFRGKMNIGKVITICQDLNVPYSVIADLDALLPGSKGDVSNAFKSYLGDWSRVPVVASELIRTVQAPASSCVKNDPQLENQLRSCTNADQVIEFYEKQRIFGWRVGGGEIEDVVQITKQEFKKKDWRDFPCGGFQDLIKEMLKGGSQYGPNPEILRCFSFIVDFLSQNLSDIQG